MNRLDRFSEITGQFTAWLTLLMVVVTFVIVVMRYVFDAGLIWMQESVVWMHAFVFMIGAAYTLQRDEHVRVDIFYREMSARGRAWIDLLGVLVFLLPLCIFLALKAWDFVAFSWALAETSRESGGLPYPLLPMLKTVLILMPAAVGLQGMSLALKSLAIIRGR
ncbi:MAG: TRAP transporter small permease subunit [Proteobacteria bacterium]|nr:TRAP transporter small permease subunit [Pseudomonadota bacterium]MCH7980468.1 TRAP transporter small permease subunit [Pseudomonadota bacterium]MCH8070618.1 TRAP transporter small permease subunit [Pseudomonadota bacterium]